MVTQRTVNASTAGSSPASPANLFYLLAVKREDGKEVLSRYDWRLQNRTLPRLIELAKAINAKPLYAVRVKLKPNAIFVPYLGNSIGPAPVLLAPGSFL